MVLGYLFILSSLSILQSSKEPSLCDSDGIRYVNRREMMQWWAGWIDENVE